MYNHLLGFSLHLECPSTQLLALNTTLRKITEAKEKTKTIITKDYPNTLLVALKHKFAMATISHK
jgi:hypothetical protein